MPTTMAQLQFPLSDLQARQVPLQWHEAVAIVLEVVEWLQRGVTRGAVPGLSDLSLTDDGRLLFHGAGSRRSDPVRQLAQLLDDLLKDTPAPQELRLLAAQDEASSSVHATAEEFGRALAFFARPDRKADLLQLSTKALIALEREHSEEEFKRLQAKAGLEDPGAKRPQIEGQQGRGRRQTRILIVLAAVVAIAVCAWAFREPLLAWGDGAWAWVSAQVAWPVSEQPAEELAAPPPTQAAQRARGRGRTPAGGAAEGLATSGGPTPGTAASGAPREEGQAAAPPSGTASGVVGPGSANATAVTLDAPTAGAAGGAPDTASTRDQAVYTQSDAEVTPPRLVRPQYPSEVPPSAQSVLVEILIDETGRVQNVRWLQSVSGYHERMLTSAIKAWRYQPATLAGKPVRYSKRLNLPRP